MLHRNGQRYIRINDDDDEHNESDSHQETILTPLRVSIPPRHSHRKKFMIGISFVIMLGFLVGASYFTLSHSKRHDNATDSNPALLPPLAQRKPSSFSIHDMTISDDFAWLKHIHNDTDVKTYIDKENAYTDEFFKTREAYQLKNDIIHEISTFESTWINHSDRDCALSHVPGSDFWFDGDYLYWIESNSSYQYPKYYRQRMESNPIDHECHCMGTMAHQGNQESPQLILDLNIWVNQTTEYFQVGFFEIAPKPFDHLIAFSLDTDGSERYVLHIVNIITSRDLIPSIPNTSDNARWLLSDDKKEVWLLYNTVDDKYGVPLSVFRTGPFAINSETSPISQLVYHEKDPALVVSVGQTADGELTFVKASGQVTSETLFVTSITRREIRLQPVRSRIDGVQYDVEKSGSYLYIRSNHALPDFGIYRASLGNISSWETILSSETGRNFYERLQVFSDHIVVWFWQGGLRSFMIATRIGSGLYEWRQYTIPQSQFLRVYSLYPATLSDMEERLRYSFNSHCFMFSNSSFIQARKTFALSMVSESMKTTILFEERYPTHNQRDYTEEQVWINRPDFPKKLPISLFYRSYNGQQFPKPLFVIGYGAYGGYQEPTFTPEFFSLVNRGFLVAILHPRGDGDLGANWYLDGKYEKKNNTFIDICHSIEGLVSLGYARKDQISLKGRSAGGLVAGNSALWPSSTCPDIALKSVIALVPFVDPIGDLLDALVPWTIFEWYEWGNPQKKSIFLSQLDYSPYYALDRYPHIRPNLYVSSGLRDPRVPFWEPVKYVAKLRNLRNISKSSDESSSLTTPSTVLLRVLDSGHFASNEGIEKISQIAEWISFVVLTTVNHDNSLFL